MQARVRDNGLFKHGRSAAAAAIQGFDHSHGGKQRHTEHKWTALLSGLGIKQHRSLFRNCFRVCVCSDLARFHIHRQTRMFVLAALLVVAAGASSNGLTLMEKDMLCLNRQFNDPSFPKPADDFCESIGFPTRWESMFPGAELGIGAGGLRALTFKSKTNAQHIAFAFREFLHDKKQFNMFDDDYWQVYSMVPPPTTSTAALTLNRAMLFFRYYMGFDYARHAQSFVDEVLGRGGGKRFPIFTGYGYGGSIAMLQALRIDQSFAITFSAPSNLRALAVDIWQARPASKRITNLCFDFEIDNVKEESSAIHCKFKTPEMYAIIFDGNVNVTSRNVFSDYGFASLNSQQQRVCRDPLL